VAGGAPRRVRARVAPGAGGSRTSQIAARLGMTDKTVRNHVSAIPWKLGVPDRTAAAIKAREAGLG
jgi:DNA-binding NarL/FixJ family response regulator